MNNQQFIDAVRAGKAQDVASLTQAAINEGVPAADIINQGLVAGMAYVGELFGQNKMFVPEVMMASRAMNAGMEIVKPLLKGDEIEVKAKCVFATVKGDLHDIGKQLVMLMMEGAGYQIHDLGTDVAPETIVKAAKEENADIIGMSAMLTTTMLAMGETTEQLAEAGLADKVKVMVGGAVIHKDFAEKINANFSKDAAEAVIVADQLMGL